MGQLHGYAMERTMLGNQGTAIDTDDFASNKDIGQNFERCRVLTIIIGGNENGPIDDEKVGIGGGQPVTIFGKAGLGPGQGDQPVGGTLGCAQSAKFDLHGGEGLKMFVLGIIAAYINDSVTRAEAGKGIDVRVGIISGQEAVIQPEEMVNT